MKTNWGVDSAAIANQDLLDCVTKEFGKPDFWGRYLTTITGASEGLTSIEIGFLKNNGIKLMPIYNNFKKAIGQRAGNIAAQNAIFNANRLSIKKGTVIFANVERFFEVDSDWLIGWVEKFYSSSYRPGFYNDPIKGGFNQAFCEAINKSQLVKDQSILWSAEPEPGVTAKRSAPKFAPKKPDCPATVWAWQYGRDSKKCPVDTVLAQSNLFESMH